MEKPQSLAKLAESMEDVKEVSSIYDTIRITLDGKMYRIEVFASPTLETWDTEVYEYKNGQWKQLEDAPYTTEKTKEDTLRTTISFLQDL